MARRDILNGAKIREIKKNKKKAFYFKMYLALFLFAVLFTGLGFLSRNHKVLINKVTISGNNVIATEDILKLTEEEMAGNYLFVFPKKNVFLYPSRRIEKDILSHFQRIREAKIKINSLTEVSISVAERESKYLWCDGEEKCYFADETGYIFDQAPSFSGSNYLKFYGVYFEPEEKIGERILPPDEFSRLAKFYDSLSKVVAPIKLTSLNILDNGDYKFSIEGTGGRILFKKENNLNKLLENFDSALNSEPLKTDFKNKLKSLLYIDLRFDNKVYFKFQE